MPKRKSGCSAAKAIYASTLFYVALSGSSARAAAAHGWNEDRAGDALQLDSAKPAYAEEFSKNQKFAGPILWAAQHADTSPAKFDPPGGSAYAVHDGMLSISVYHNGSGLHGGNVQSLNAGQSYQGQKIEPGTRGFACAGCYWEARLRFPDAYGSWGGFWLLTPDNPGHRGHLEVDGIEYYGNTDRRGHHHTIHRWATKEAGGHTMHADYTGMDAIADHGWHSYGIDLRGKTKLDGKPALVLYFDGREVGRIAADADYFGSPFYYLLTLVSNPADKSLTVPQAMDVDYVRAWSGVP
jgi:hypothetical protein